MNNSVNTFIIRLTLAIIMLYNSIPSFLTLDFSSFNCEYLVNKGFSLVVVTIAILIKLILLLSSFSLLSNKCIKVSSLLNIIILLSGIIYENYLQGLYIVDGGMNCIGFRLVLLSIFVSFLIPEGIIGSLEFPSDIDLNIKED